MGNRVKAMVPRIPFCSYGCIDLPEVGKGNFWDGDGSGSSGHLPHHPIMGLVSTETGNSVADSQSKEW